MPGTHKVFAKTCFGDALAPGAVEKLLELKIEWVNRGDALYQSLIRGRKKITANKCQRDGPSWIGKRLRKVAKDLPQ